MRVEIIWSMVGCLVLLCLFIIKRVFSTSQKELRISFGESGVLKMDNLLVVINPKWVFGSQTLSLLGYIIKKGEYSSEAYSSLPFIEIGFEREKAIINSLRWGKHRTCSLGMSLSSDLTPEGISVGYRSVLIVTLERVGVSNTF